jgi:hypothetical protein
MVWLFLVVQVPDPSDMRRVPGLLRPSVSAISLWSKGFGADETKAAFIRAQQLAGETGSATERFDTKGWLRTRSSAAMGWFESSRSTETF